MQILVVEDDVRIASVLRRGLVQEGFAVDVVMDGAEGLERARTGAYDAMILDILLPSLNGYKICESLRAEGVWTPILMLSAKTGEYDHAEALDTGADDFLSKPFSFVVLLAHLRALLRRSRVERPAVLVAGDLRLDPAARKCWRGEQSIELSPRQFALLEFLLRRKGEACSKTEILDHVWDVAFEGDPNIVEVYVRNIRLKLDIPFGRRAIQTVRGAGYRLDPDGG